MTIDKRIEKKLSDLKRGKKGVRFTKPELAYIGEMVKKSVTEALTIYANKNKKTKKRKKKRK